MKTKSLKHGAGFSLEPRMTRITSSSSTLILDFEDGRTVHLPLLWYPRLFRATQAQRDNWEFIGPGVGIHWPDVDEDLSAESLLVGRPSIEFLRAQESRRRKGKVPA